PHVELDSSGEPFTRRLGERHRWSAATELARRRGRVHEDVGARPEALDDSFEYEALLVGGTRDVGTNDESRRRSRRIDHGGRLLERAGEVGVVVLAATHDCDSGSFRGEANRDRLTDAAAGARDERDMSLT